MNHFMRGFISYDEWVAYEARLLRDLSIDVFRAIIKAIPWRQGIEKLVEFRQSRRGDYFIAVTGGFALLGLRAVEELGFDDYIGVELEVDERGRITGFARSYPDFYGKGTALLDYLAAKGIQPEKIICIGDNVNDLGMFRVCDVSIAFCPANGVKVGDVDVYVVSCDMRKLVEVLKSID